MTSEKEKTNGERKKQATPTTNSPRDTPPLRLAVLSGEKMNECADFEIRKSPMADLKSANHPMSRSQKHGQETSDQHLAPGTSRAELFCNRIES